VIRGCARGSNWSQTRRSGPGKRAAFDGVASGSGPGTSSLGGESNPVNPSAGSATGSVRGRYTTLAPGRQRREEGALLGGPPDQGPAGPIRLSSRETGDNRAIHAEAGSSSSSEAPLDHALRQGFGRVDRMEAAITGESCWKR
jgi:hypothetical protein